MNSNLRVMVLDGDYPHTLPVQSELKKYLGATIYSVSSNRRSPGYLSRTTDVRLLGPRSISPDFPDALTRLVEEYRPDIVVPIGYAASASTLDSLGSFPENVKSLVADRTSFEIAASKTSTYEVAEGVCVRAPREIPTIQGGKPSDASPFPMFAKARIERGGVSTALISSLEELNSFDPEELGGDVLYQEVIDGNSFTYAHNGYYENGKLVTGFQHVEHRSVPRRGGSGTRLQTIDEPLLQEKANALLSKINWNGIAQVEFKISRTGEFVLMEINPKVWASYSLATRSGNPIMATAVSRILNTPFITELPEPKVGLSMIFPFRELAHAVKFRRSESVAESVRSLIWPPASLDFELLDLHAVWPRRLFSKGTR